MDAANRELESSPARSRLNLGFGLATFTTSRHLSDEYKSLKESQVVNLRAGGHRTMKMDQRKYIFFQVYLELVYLVTALVPSDTACLANSPGRRRRTAVWISREVMVDLNIRT